MHTLVKMFKQDLIHLAHEVDRSLLIGKIEKVIGLVKDELGRNIMNRYVHLRPEMH